MFRESGIPEGRDLMHPLPDRRVVDDVAFRELDVAVASPGVEGHAVSAYPLEEIVAGQPEERQDLTRSVVSGKVEDQGCEVRGAGQIETGEAPLAAQRVRVDGEGARVPVFDVEPSFFRLRPLAEVEAPECVLRCRRLLRRCPPARILPRSGHRRATSLRLWGVVKLRRPYLTHLQQFARASRGQLPVNRATFGMECRFSRRSWCQSFR